MQKLRSMLLLAVLSVCAFVVFGLLLALEIGGAAWRSLRCGNSAEGGAGIGRAEDYDE